MREACDVLVLGQSVAGALAAVHAKRRAPCLDVVMVLEPAARPAPEATVMADAAVLQTLGIGLEVAESPWVHEVRAGLWHGACELSSWLMGRLTGAPSARHGPLWVIQRDAFLQSVLALARDLGIRTVDVADTDAEAVGRWQCRNVWIASSAQSVRMRQWQSRWTATHRAATWGDCASPPLQGSAMLVTEVWGLPERTGRARVIQAPWWNRQADSHKGLGVLCHGPEQYATLHHVRQMDFRNPWPSPFESMAAWQARPAIEKVLRGGVRLSQETQVVHVGRCGLVHPDAFVTVLPTVVSLTDGPWLRELWSAAEAVLVAAEFDANPAPVWPTAGLPMVGQAHRIRPRLRQSTHALRQVPRAVLW